MRAIFIVLVSLAGIWLSFTRSAIYGLYAYLWFAYIRAQDITRWVSWLPALRLSFALAVSVILSALIQGEKLFYPHRLSFLILVLWLCFLVSTVFSSVSAVSWDTFWEMTKVFIMGSLIAGLSINRERFHRICLVITICLAFYGVKVGIFSLRGGQIQEGPGGIMQDNNTFAMVLVMTIPFMYYLGHTFKGWMKRGFHYSIPLVMWGVVGTNSRGGFLALVSLLIIMVLYTGGRLRWFAIGIFLFAIFSWQFLPDSYKERIGTIHQTKQAVDSAPTLEEAEGDASALGRIHFWKVAWVMAQENPILGTGLGTYISRYNDYDFSNGFFGRSKAVHNSYMEMLSNNGFPAFGIYITLFLTTFLENQKIRKEIKAYPSLAWATPYTYMIEMSILAFLVGSFFLSVAYADLPYHIVCLVIGLRHVLKNEVGLLSLPYASQRTK